MSIHLSKIKKSYKSYASIFSLNIQILSLLLMKNCRPAHFTPSFCDCANTHSLTKETTDKCSGEEYQTHTFVKNTPPSKSISPPCQISNIGVWFISKQNTADIILVTPTQGLSSPFF